MSARSWWENLTSRNQYVGAVSNVSIHSTQSSMKVQFCRVSEKTIHKYNHLLVKLVGRRLQTVVESERVTSKQTKSVDTEWRRPSENCRLLKYLTPATEVERANTTQTLGRPFDWSENIQKLFAPQTLSLIHTQYWH